MTAPIASDRIVTATYGGKASPADLNGLPPVEEPTAGDVEAVVSRMARDVPLERARLAVEDPDGEAEAVVPLLPVHEIIARGEWLPGEPLAAFLARDAGPVRWFGPIPDGAMAAFVGRPETFKSFAAVQLGLAGACGAQWLGMDLGEPRPFVYVSAEKSGSTVRNRLERMSEILRPAATVWVIHREGITFGDSRAWDGVCRVVQDLGRPFVVVDTVASLAGPGFDENSGRDMAVVLGAARRLVDAGGTVALLHHPSKHGDGTGGIRLRGHTSLWGEVDATVEFTRPDRAIEAGIARIEPKDGDLRLVPFRWDRETFLIEPETGLSVLTAASLAAVVDALYDGIALSSDRLIAEFPSHGRTVLLERLRDAVDAGMVARVGRGRATGYVPVPRSMSADDSVLDRLPLEPAPTVPGHAFTRESSAAHEPSHTGIVRADDESSANRPGRGHSAESSVRPGGSIYPRADDSKPDRLSPDEGSEPAGHG